MTTSHNWMEFVSLLSKWFVNDFDSSVLKFFSEYEKRKGHFGDYCPVSFVLRDELVDCQHQEGKIYHIISCNLYESYNMTNHLKACDFVLNTIVNTTEYWGHVSSISSWRNHQSIWMMQFNYQNICPNQSQPKNRTNGWRKMVKLKSKASVLFRTKMETLLMKHLHGKLQLPVRLPVRLIWN